MKTQYRIIKKNSSICWVYTIQRKFWFMWINTYEQPFYCTSLEDTEDTLEDIISARIEFEKRKKAGNSVIIKT